jgi:sugar phosphate isomerase/epimerase
MLSVKIFDRNRAGDLPSVVSRLEADGGIGVELANYGGNGFGPLEARIAALPARRKSVHLHHDRYSLLDLVGAAAAEAAEAAEALAREAAFYSRLGVGAGAVMHVARTAAVTRRVGAELVHDGAAPDVAAVAEAVAVAAEGAAALGPLFVENTFEDIGWFERLFARLGGLPGVGVCLDVGHAKIWGGAPLPEWLDFCASLAGAGRPVHSHVHCNRGRSDDHLPLVRGHEEGLFAPSPFHPGGLLPELVRLSAICGDEHFVLEIPIDDCLENLDWSRAALGA